MKVEIRTFKSAGWIVPLMLLIALVLLPFALMLALALMTAALGAAVFRALLSSTQGDVIGSDARSTRKLGHPTSGPSIIDAEYEVKEKDEKNEPH